MHITFGGAGGGTLNDVLWRLFTEGPGPVTDMALGRFDATAPGMPLGLGDGLFHMVREMVVDWLAQTATGPALSFAHGGWLHEDVRGIGDSGRLYQFHSPEYVMPRSEYTQRGGGDIVINVDARGALDPRAVEDAGYRGAQKALREVGRDADIMIRRSGR